MRRAVVLLFLAVLPRANPGLAESIRFEELTGHRARLLLPAELGESWREVNVGRLAVRTIEKQAALDRHRLPAAAELELAVGSRGCSLIEVDLGPPESRGRTDSWQRVTRCTKIIVCASASRLTRRRSSALITGKTGSRIEIRPLLNPAALIPGSDLPVRLYFGGEAVNGVAVEAVGPAGAEERSTSDDVGIAFLRIPSPGLWRARFSHRGATAELVFDVLADARAGAER